MIETLHGLGVGAGKSYYVVCRLINLLKDGGTAFISDSMEVFPDKIADLIARRYRKRIEPDQIRMIPSQEIWRVHEVTCGGTEDNPVLIILDEAQDGLNARGWNELVKEKRALFAWCCQSRHDDNDLLFVTQHEANIDKQIRRLCTYSHRVRNMQKFKIPGIGRLPPPWRNRFVLSTYDQGGTNLLGKEWVPMDKEIFACYRSKSMRGKHVRRGMAIPKKQLETVQPSRKRVMKTFVIVMALFVVVTGFWAWKRFHSQAVIPVTATHPEAVSRPMEVPERGKGSYEAFEEVFLATDGRSYLITKKDEYYVGGLCARGMVLGIQDRVVKVAAPDGHIIYVLGRDRVSGEDEEIVAPPPPVATQVFSPVTSAEHALGSMAFRGSVANASATPSYTPQIFPSHPGYGAASVRPSLPLSASRH